MFGLETPDFAAIQLRSETLFKHPVEGAVLAQLAGPTEADPFQFMGITWLEGQRSWPLNLVTQRRDFVVVSATGVMLHTNGDLIGYEVVQSIDLPQCPRLSKPTVRGKVMYGVIYTQRDDGDVDVVKRTIKEPDESGNLDLHIAVCRVCMLFVQHQEPADIALDNQKQREAHRINETKTEKKNHSAVGSGWALPMISPGRYPSISVSDLLKMINSVSDLGVGQVQRASETMRRNAEIQSSIPVL
ncbi:hypothetical protein PInf_011644 [Phytophthora infestans]|nr:hypothetical protein PInf_011644 [Phytophthora infestans]